MKIMKRRPSPSKGLLSRYNTDKAVVIIRLTGIIDRDQGRAKGRTRQCFTGAGERAGEQLEERMD